MSLHGKKIENFELKDQNGNLFRLSDQKGKKSLIVFYPGDETAVCTKQLCSYNSSLSDFANLGVQIVGINRDSEKSHKQFSEKYKFGFPLLSDEKGEIVKIFNVDGLLGTKRAVFLLDEEQKVVYEYVEALPIFYRKNDELLEEIKKRIS
jgi:peroxiredoxin